MKKVLLLAVNNITGYGKTLKNEKTPWHDMKVTKDQMYNGK